MPTLLRNYSGSLHGQDVYYLAYKLLNTENTKQQPNKIPCNFSRDKSRAYTPHESVNGVCLTWCDASGDTHIATISKMPATICIIYSIYFFFAWHLSPPFQYVAAASLANGQKSDTFFNSFGSKEVRAVGNRKSFHFFCVSHITIVPCDNDYEKFQNDKQLMRFNALDFAVPPRVWVCQNGKLTYATAKWVK